ncbi:MAG: hypothetical protein HGA96_15145 [Desulfobulbaceae bacterium]|nr:hypothetical protein [Desulfobulbaceae bacterium]
MKKLTTLIAFAMLFPVGLPEARADYGDIKNQVETEASIWLGGYLNDTSSSVNGSLAEQIAPRDAAQRVGSNKASEWYSLKSSVSGGVLFKSSPLPSRFHLELDYYNGEDWFGDLRYSYKDYVLVRLLPRRLVHNLDNLTLFNFGGQAVSNLDAGIEDYRVRVDIDQFKLRFKAPNYPLHVYTDGEVVIKKGARQLHFVGGNAATPGNVRVSESKQIDQKTQTLIVGSNAHLGPVEIDLSHKNRNFKSDVAPSFYGYTVDPAGAPPAYALDAIHNYTPELKATTNTLKVHTSHTGRVVASATFSELKKTNEYSQAEADSSFGYGEVTWVPVSYFSLAAKYRHIENEASAPITVRAVNQLALASDYKVDPGVHSATDTAIVTARYSLIPKTNLNLQYTRQIKDVESESAYEWSRPQSTIRDIYEFGLTNWAIPKVRTTVKLSHTRVGNDLGNTEGLAAGEQPATIEPAHTSHGNIGVTMQVSPRVTAFANGVLTKMESHDNRLVGGESAANDAEAFNQQYVLSLAFAVNKKFSISPTYTYLSWDQKGDLWWRGAVVSTSTAVAPASPNFTYASAIIDPSYSTKQKAKQFAVAINILPTKRVSLNASLDYTITMSSTTASTSFAQNQIPTQTNPNPNPVTYFPDAATIFSEVSTKEMGVRLDSEYDLGRGWGIGLDLRYVDWENTSADNPSDGIFYGGLFKVSKKLFY